MSPLARSADRGVLPFLEVYRDALVGLSQTSILSVCIDEALISSRSVLLIPPRLLVYLLVIFVVLGPLMPLLAVAGAVTAVVRGGRPKTFRRFFGTALGFLGAVAFAAGSVPAAIVVWCGLGDLLREAHAISDLELHSPFVCSYLAAAGFVTQLFDLCVQLVANAQLADSFDESGDLQYGQDETGRQQFNDRVVLFRTVAHGFRVRHSLGADVLFDSWLLRLLPLLLEASREAAKAEGGPDRRAGGRPRLRSSRSSEVTAGAVGGADPYDFSPTVEMFFVGKLGFWMILGTVLLAASQAALPLLWRRTMIPEQPGEQDERLAAAVAVGYMLVSSVSMFMLLAYANSCLTLFNKLKWRALVILYLSSTEHYRRFLRRAYRSDLSYLVFVPLAEEGGGLLGGGGGAAAGEAVLGKEEDDDREGEEDSREEEEEEERSVEEESGEEDSWEREEAPGVAGGGALPLLGLAWRGAPSPTFGPGGEQLGLLEMDAPAAGLAAGGARAQAALARFALTLRRPRLAPCDAAGAPCGGALGQRLRGALPGALPLHTLDVGKFLLLRKILRILAVLERVRAQGAVACLLVLIVVSVAGGCADVVHARRVNASAVVCLFDGAVFAALITVLINRAIQLNLILHDVTEEMLGAWLDKLERLQWVLHGACGGVSEEHVLVGAYFRSVTRPLEYAVDNIQNTERPVGFFGVPLTGRLRDQLVLSIAGSLIFFAQKVLVKLDLVQQHMQFLPHFAQDS